ncbi:hypothetical protein PPYR_08126 [Photinus pyralis]|uniref:DDE Tnp4 domain-containing protein n=1 Tax=Photinus pyralis TaxID=7054 RepID=A0A5N4AIG2_PHOPY|nr:hypothetical protein PPYR_08126 [Photinus pyralis]
MYSTRVHESSISRFIPEVAQAIYKHLHIKYVKTPDTVGEWLTIAEEFDNLWQFPNCLGALDGRHIKFTPPRSDGSYFFNYKGDHSIVLLALADARYKFSYINVGCNGRVSDGGGFKDSALATAMSTNRLNFPPATALPGRIRPVPYVIVADDACPLKDAIMKPYPFRGLSHDERIFNYRLSRARRIIENAFGILANRFRVLLNPIHLRVTKVETITLACVALHNYLATENGNLYTDLNENDCTKEDINKISRQGGNKSTQNARDIREEFKQYFCSNIGSVEWQERAVNNYNM